MQKLKTTDNMLFIIQYLKKLNFTNTDLKYT